MTIYQPFTYFIMWKSTGMKYYGVRYASKKGGSANPLQLWKTYFTSSNHVTSYRKKHGEPDVVIVHRIFETAEDARSFEESYLQKVGCKHKKDWLNKNDRRGQPILLGENNPMFGKKAPEKTKQGVENIRNRQLKLVDSGDHPFQKEHVRLKTKNRQLFLSSLGNHAFQTEDYRNKKRLEAIERNKTEKMKTVTKNRNQIMNSTFHVCPNCGTTGKGPNMKRYHFAKCKTIMCCI